MPETWKLSAQAPRATIEAALAAQDVAIDWDAEIVVAGSEVAEDRPDEWRLDAWLPRRPHARDLAAVRSLFKEPAPSLTVERLAERDWVAESQAGIEPIVAGRFRIRTPEHPSEPRRNQFEFTIPASCAFGTGHHATTAGCLEMLSTIADRGFDPTRIIDVGTGTGLLAFAARALWPKAVATASDIDPVCADVVRENAALNQISLGNGSGELAVVIADGLDHPELAALSPFDLLIANILAGPLIDMAPGFASSLAQDGQVVLAGLLTSQEAAVRDAYERASLMLVEHLTRGDWSILWLYRGG